MDSARNMDLPPMSICRSRLEEMVGQQDADVFRSIMISSCETCTWGGRDGNARVRNARASRKVGQERAEPVVVYCRVRLL